jgi:hypothetical protein
MSNLLRYEVTALGAGAARIEELYYANSPEAARAAYEADFPNSAPVIINEFYYSEELSSSFSVEGGKREVSMTREELFAGL